MNTLTNEQIESMAKGSKQYTHDDVTVIAARLLSVESLLPGLLADRAQLAELRGQAPLGCIEVEDGAIIDYRIPAAGLSNGWHDLFANPAPPAASQPIIPDGLHPDTAKLVTDFASALAEKLYKAQIKYAYDVEWKRDGWPTQCLAHFHQHIAKGDPRDVAAYCAFMWFHGWKTELPAIKHLECPYQCGWDNLNQYAMKNAATLALGLVEDEIITESIRNASIENNDRLIKLIAHCRKASKPDLSSIDENLIGRDVLFAIREVARIRVDLNDFDGDKRGIADLLSEAERELIAAVTKNAATLQFLCDFNEPQSQPYTVPDGWVMVPIEPTNSMINAWLSEIANFRGHTAGYKAMLSAAPPHKGE